MLGKGERGNAASDRVERCGEEGETRTHLAGGLGSRARMYSSFMDASLLLGRVAKHRASCGAADGAPAKSVRRTLDANIIIDAIRA